MFSMYQWQWVGNHWLLNIPSSCLANQTKSSTVTQLNLIQKIVTKQGAWVDIELEG